MTLLLATPQGGKRSNAMRNSHAFPVRTEGLVLGAKEDSQPRRWACHACPVSNYMCNIPRARTFDVGASADTGFKAGCFGAHVRGHLGVELEKLIHFLWSSAPVRRCNVSKPVHDGLAQRSGWQTHTPSERWHGC